MLSEIDHRRRISARCSLGGSRNILDGNARGQLEYAVHDDANLFQCHAFQRAFAQPVNQSGSLISARVLRVEFVCFGANGTVVVAALQVNELELIRHVTRGDQTSGSCRHLESVFTKTANDTPQDGR